MLAGSQIRYKHKSLTGESSNHATVNEETWRVGDAGHVARDGAAVDEEAWRVGNAGHVARFDSLFDRGSGGVEGSMHVEQV